MSKIICDICGTSYPETSSQCPICGSLRPGDVQSVTNEVKNDGNVSTGYTYVKGGRFSKSNVKKRNRNMPIKRETSKDVSAEPKEGSSKNNSGLVITAIVLMLAIIAVVIYIALRFFAPFENNKQEQPPKDDSQVSDQKSEEIDNAEDADKDADNSDTDKTDVPCDSVTLDVSTITFENPGESHKLNVVVEPADSTDIVTFVSGDESVATVSIDGEIVAVGKGTTIITVTCGEQNAACVVTCEFGEEDQDTQQGESDTEGETQQQPTDTEFRLNRKDITFGAKDDSWELYSGTIAKNLVTFTSDDESVAKFVNGKVVAVGPGTTEVHAEYEGVKITCVIRCTFKESTGVSGNGGGVSEDGGGSSGEVNTGSCSIYTQYGSPVTDISIKNGEQVTLTLKDAAGNAISVTWSVSGSGCTISGNTLTGAVSGTVTTVSASYNGSTYSCIIRVN